ncbi:MAG TPA: hypothetical protein VF006_01290 [Longimicrobium sp.]
MVNYKEDAEALRCGLLAGYVTVRETVAWADAVIAREPAPDPAIIEVALAGRQPPADVVALLRDVPGDADPIRVRRRLLARMLQVLDGDPTHAERIARWLYQLAVHGELPEEAFGWQAYGLDDTFELARTGVYGSHAAAVTELREYLHRHSVPTAAEPGAAGDVRPGIVPE